MHRQHKRNGYGNGNDARIGIRPSTIGNNAHIGYGNVVRYLKKIAGASCPDESLPLEKGG